MLEEIGTVVEVESGALWVETVQRSACGGCAARQGCGQHALGKVLSTSSTIRALLETDDREKYELDQQVVIGVPEEIITRGAMLVYLTPLLSLLGSAMIANYLGAGEGLIAVAALLGLAAGGCLVRWHAGKTRDDPRLQPVVLRPAFPTADICPV